MRTYTITLRDGFKRAYWTRSFSDALSLLRAEMSTESEVRLGSIPRSASIQSVSIDPPPPEEAPE